MLKRAVFLDRDGVLNRAPVVDGKPKSPRTLAELEILESAREACSLLKAAGYVLIGVTNQPDIARGKVSAEAVQEINKQVKSELALDDLITCPHDNADQCQCRKPKPGMLIDAATAHEIDLRHSVMVGDRASDIKAGNAAGCRTVFIDHGYAESKPESADFNCTNLLEAAPWILKTGDA